MTQTMTYYKKLNGFAVNTLALILQATEELGFQLESRMVPAGMFGQGEREGMNRRDIILGSDTYTLIWGSCHLLVPGGKKYEIEIDIERIDSILFRGQKGSESAMDMLTAKIRQVADDFHLFRGRSISLGRSVLDVTEFAGLKDKPLFNPALELELECSVYAPLNSGDMNRGVLLAGSYGTGKSSIASYLAHYTQSTNKSFIYLTDSSNYPDMYKLARKYFGPTVLFVEDIDEAVDEERDHSLNRLLNSMDSVDSKDGGEVTSIFTTNSIDNIERALLRPGRIDAVIQTTLPNAEVTRGILTRYLGEPVSEVFVSTLPPVAPAFLRELATRAKYLGKMRGLSPNTQLDTAYEMLRSHIELVNSSRNVKKPTLDTVFSDLIQNNSR